MNELLSLHVAGATTRHSSQFSNLKIIEHNIIDTHKIENGKLNNFQNNLIKLSDFDDFFEKA